MTHSAEKDAPRLTAPQRAAITEAVSGPIDRYQVVLDALRTEHQAQIWSSAMQWGWSCSCGKGGSCTTNGRAAAARDKHLNAERKRIHERVIPPGMPVAEAGNQ